MSNSVSLPGNFKILSGPTSLSRHLPVKVKLTDNKHYWLKAHLKSDPQLYGDIGLEYFALSIGYKLGVSPAPIFFNVSVDEASVLWPELIVNDITIDDSQCVGCLGILDIPDTVSEFNSFKRFENNELVHMFQLWLNEYDGHQVLFHPAKKKVYAIDLECWDTENDNFMTLLTHQSKKRYGAIFEYGKEWFKFLDLISESLLEQIVKEFPDISCLDLGSRANIIIQNLMDRVFALSKLSSVAC